VLMVTFYWAGEASQGGGGGETASADGGFEFFSFVGFAC
jgi:hypothetical protein